MKNFIRIFIVALVVVSLAFSASFPKGVILFKNGTELKVKKVLIEENFVFYDFKGEKQSTLLDDIVYIKARGKIQKMAGNIAGGAGVVFWSVGIGGFYSRNPFDPTSTSFKVITGVAVGSTLILYATGRMVGGILDPWKKIYISPAQE